DYPKNGIGLRPMAQRYPLVEFQRIGYEMFTTIKDGIKEGVVLLTNTRKMQVSPSVPASGVDSDVVVDASGRRHTTPKMQLSAPSEDGSSLSDSEDDDEPAPANRAQRRAKKKAKS